MTKEKALKWLKAAAIRAIRTFAQTFASLITVGAVASEIDWEFVASSSIVAAVYSLATSLAGLPEVEMEILAGLPEVETEVSEPEVDKEADE